MRLSLPVGMPMLASGHRLKSRRICSGSRVAPHFVPLYASGLYDFFSPRGTGNVFQRDA
jgi:hypothetical protein